MKLFHDMLSADPDRVCYGSTHVFKANEQLAISDLLISDQIYRTSNIQLRNKYVNLMELVKTNGGKVYKFSSLHATGLQLNLYTGIAAILRFPIPDEDDDDDLSSDDSIVENLNIKICDKSINYEHDISAYI